MNASPHNSGLYIHLPFCRQKCHYCDFASYAGKEDMIDQYVTALINEIQFLTSNLQLLTSIPQTIYFGGGTPTLLTPRHFELIIKTIICNLPAPPWRRSLDICNCEVSIEANPGTVDKGKLAALRQLGINRISFGAQTFNPAHLKTLGRIHNAKEIYAAVDAARNTGFSNLNLDLIFALPGQTLKEWKDDLKQALALRPEHISAYNLHIEEGTPFGERYKEKSNYKDQIPSEELELAMYDYAIDRLTGAGYRHYEISNFARPGFECQHNINYWKNGNYLGVGAAASSHINGNRFDNPKTIDEYLKWAPGSETAKNGNPDKSLSRKIAKLSHPNQPDPGETIFMGLRLLRGISVDKFERFKPELASLLNDRLLEIDSISFQPQSLVKLTHTGLRLANQVFINFV